VICNAKSGPELVILWIRVCRLNRLLPRDDGNRNDRQGRGASVTIIELDETMKKSGPLRCR